MTAKPNTESDKSIDEILRRAPNEDGYIEDEDMKIAKSQLLAEILKVIGEDEPDETDKWTPEMESYIRQARQVIYGRNALRAEQRAKLTELFNVKEK